jgi:aryl-alcohol dehydrogenase-like predicted oxidoreductase
MRIGATDLDVHGLCLGTNVFGWTCDEQEAFAVLDAYRHAGGNFLDTADIYPWFERGGGGAVSEETIGRWAQSRGCRDEIMIATKVGAEEGLGAANIRRRAEESLRRLQTDHIDLYYAHEDDAATPLEETLEAFDTLVREGKVRYLGLCDHTPARMEEALRISHDGGLARYEALQIRYSLVDRSYESELAEVVARHGLSTLSYSSLAHGFLTGKYRPGYEAALAGAAASPRAPAASAYLASDLGPAILAALDEVAAHHAAAPATVALAWLLAQPSVVSALASARTPEQLRDLLAATTLELQADELALLAQASAAALAEPA